MFSSSDVLQMTRIERSAEAIAYLVSGQIFRSEEQWPVEVVSIQQVNSGVPNAAQTA